MTARALLVQGTWGWGQTTDLQWWECKSPFCAFLQRWGVEVIGGDRPFIWSTALDGLGGIMRHRGAKHRHWQNAGYALDAYCRPPLLDDAETYIDIADRNFVCHSHALQVIAYACAGGLKINRLVTIGSPIRADMAAVYKAARPNIGRWLHVHSDRSDSIQWLGELLDGHLGIVREAPLANRNVLIGDVSHTKLLTDADRFYLWQTRGLLEFLKGMCY